MKIRMWKVGLGVLLAVVGVAAGTTYDEALAASQDDKYLKAGDGIEMDWSITVEFPESFTQPKYVWIHFRASPDSTNFSVQFYNGDTAVGLPQDLWSATGIFGPFGWYNGWTQPINRVMIKHRQQAGAGAVYIDAVTDGDYYGPGTVFAHYFAHTGPLVAFPDNAPPVAADDATQTEAGVAATTAVLDNDHDGDGDPLSVTSVGAATNGSATINTDNTVTYMPDAGFTGLDQFPYTISDGNGGTSTATVFVTVSPRNVQIDIKPGSYPNSINLGSNGVVPIAILSEADFDATSVDPATVSLAGAGVAVRGKGSRLMASNEDVNADGLLDLVLQVETENLDPTQLQDGHATVVGTTYAGNPITGTDDITIIPQ